MTRVLGRPEDSGEVTSVRNEVKTSQRVASLLSNRGDDGRIDVAKGVYAKWQGAHWILSTLADLGYPTGAEELRPIADQVLDTWLAEDFFTEFEATSKSQVYSRKGVPVMRGRHRRCASQQANALWSILTLGLYSERCDQLVERLLHWQWPDGGWNCDKNPEASKSSFVETLFPLRALALYSTINADGDVQRAVERAAEIFLSRHLFRRISDGNVIREEFTKLHYPTYWHYDILVGLRAMVESGFINDQRCSAALDLLESKRLDDGGWPAESKYYKVSNTIQLGADYVDWGGTSIRRMNEWVTVDALSVLQAADRLG